MEQSLVDGVAVENQLAGEDDRPRELLVDFDAQVFQFVDWVGTDRHE